MSTMEMSYLKPGRSYQTGETLDSPCSDAMSNTESTAPLTELADRDDIEATGADMTSDRGNWSGKFDFLLSLLGYSVGLGNVWRFPYLAYSNGGGAFLLPFLVMLMLVGIPLMFMELAFGQFASLGPVAIFQRFCPLFQGVGYGMIIVSSIVALYYNMIIAWTLFYLFASFTDVLPWDTCGPGWSSNNCYSYKEADYCQQTNGSLYYNKTCFNNTMVERYSIASLTVNMTKRPPAEEYFENYVLAISKGMDDMGPIRWQLALCLLLAWLIVFLCLSKGVQSSGKVVYFTALFPYVVLIILFFRGVTLPGAGEGIRFYLTPDFSRLKTAKVWTDAAVQIFFSLSPAWGGLITLASYNKFYNDCFKDAMIVSISNISTSIFAGFVIFSIVGYLAHEMKTDVGKVVDQGAGLAFIVYPEVVTRLPVSPVWAVLFFVMLLTLGLDSMFALLETVTTALLDKFPDYRERKTWIVLAMCTLGYIGGLTICTNGGMYMLQLMDSYAASWSVFLLAIIESVLIGWVYGAERFCVDCETMLGPKSYLWKTFFSIFWKVLSPGTLLFLLIFNWVQYRPITYGHYVYPAWANILGWLMALMPVLIVPTVAIYKICTTSTDKTILQRISILLTPTDEWGPAHKVNNMSLGITEEVHSLGVHLKAETYDNPNFNKYTYENVQPK
ncbi:unnamed protein product [Owenia fusiformis]|uniref:Transporter n=1 Tax=Owenia fusiformis TaxID=6347 RepID=A0A8S4P256_OWEFU|nr:unnamed protein product [Owenia fusiformis]